MKLGTIVLLGFGALGIAGVAGCDVYVHPPEAAVEVDAGTPVVYDSYYVGGHYDGEFWVWRDHEGHFFRERRAFHERRLVDRDHRAVEHREIEHHEEHHDEHR